MPGLADSRWAPKYNHAITYTRSTRSNGGSTTTTETTTTRSTTTTHPLPRTEPIRPPASYNELTRYTKIVRRLKWKLPYLASAYRQAVDRVGPDVDQARVAEAELMFKIDFFEYYMLIERALVHLLGVFGITVSRGFASHHHHYQNGSGSETDTPSNGTFSYPHRYHANVLEALDSPENPLHTVLGTGEVRRQLWRAKDLRNRWKNVDDPTSTSGGANGNYKGAAVASAPLESYDLEHILVIIFEGFDRAFAIAEQFVLDEVQSGKKTEKAGEENCVVDTMDGFELAATEEEQWDFMVEAMDWEAV